MDCNFPNEENTDSKAVHIKNQVYGEGPSFVIDLSDIIHQLKELEKQGAPAEEKSKIIENPVKTENGLLYIEYINFHFDENDEDNKIMDLALEGYYFYNYQ